MMFELECGSRGSDRSDCQKTGMTVEGGDGEPGCEKKAGNSSFRCRPAYGEVTKSFRAPVTFTPDSDSITIDFTSKGGPAATLPL